ncbi:MULTISPECIES: cyclic nucleotide-binding domain-containing protein [Mesorhizobium]|uniref:Transcriptional regulator n=1 Tax=Mesorhizobium denitrificans TaxID=2294114 RepID=A0A371XED4_9HYPH|nr:MULTISPECIES: cyclic nucleotide-binding domain-containing protein [Mesorhizobium]RFC67576.1 transcriptional regulator [Mesorhizobium denitrificans]
MRAEEKPGFRRLPLFREMMTQTFDSLMQIAYSQNFPPRMDLIQQGEYADFLHILVEGAVELRATWNGHESVMGIVRPVSTFILAACVCDAPYLMSARTLERSRIVMIPAADLRAALRRDPDFAVAAMRELGVGYRTFVRHAKNLKLRNSRERLAAYILQQSQLANGVVSMVLPMEKRHLASYLGMTPENLSRTVKALRADGVRFQGTQVIITDPARLMALAATDSLIDGPDPENIAS